ncbi:CRISPR-associated endoribonuclease Cas6 [Haloferax sp. ATB1]|uniref:CRISPR-associated endoribonuclease Cas6 n=1 Tax=Haloferax sp. ATB1 TaxID=1508454 RepID=UPI0009E19881|nr:CRISPR-associated endoribonuclease Cas6 [Haloferax sp. ATB1]
MRLLTRLRARSDAAYDNAYHHKLRGRIWRALRGTKYDEYHDADRPVGFSYSNPFPPYDMEEGDERTLLVAAPQEDLLAEVAEDFITDRELNIGEMPFHIDEMTSISPDVGEPGTSGTIESGTGLLVRIPPWRADDYGIEKEGEQAIFWRPKHSMEPLKVQLENNLDKKHNLFCPEYLPGPSDTEYDLFDSYELIKTFAIPVTVSQGEEFTYVLSKWKFGYTVRDDDHRRHLNLALDTGLGEKNALGLGFINISDHGK